MIIGKSSKVPGVPTDIVLGGDQLAVRDEDALLLGDAQGGRLVHRQLERDIRSRRDGAGGGKLRPVWDDGQQGIVGHRYQEGNGMPDDGIMEAAVDQIWCCPRWFMEQLNADVSRRQTRGADRRTPPQRSTPADPETESPTARSEARRW
jgi:hypothetical protein